MIIQLKPADEIIRKSNITSILEVSYYIQQSERQDAVSMMRYPHLCIIRFKELRYT